ncbi:MAG TPA: hypothetical protein VMS02_06360, partial [Solirubrobacteraceae bacterium]|nr:hypothetical protein [Solirubrobacteraceae bacterium]
MALAVAPGPAAMTSQPKFRDDLYRLATPPVVGSETLRTVNRPMTIHRAHYLSRVCLPVLLSGLSLLLVLAVNARASSPWGESAHVALAAATKAGETGIDVERHSPLAFAGNPADGDFYVADVVEEGAKPKFRLQLFGREGTHRGSVEFATPETAKSQTESSAVELQLAVDPARNRVYVLVVYTRRGVTEGEENELSKEETRLEKEGKKCERHISCFERFPLDSEERVAGEIYAFDYNGSELLPAKLKEGVAVPITTQGGLAAQGETPKEALLDPRGMAVEPGTGNLLITGQEDEQENLKVEKEEGSRQCRAVAQFVSVKESKGELTGKLGTRYVDDEQKLRELTCELGESESVPYSPIVTAGGKVFAEESHAEGGEIWELPESTEKATGAKIEVKGEEVPQLITKPRLAYALDPKQTLLSFGAEGTSGPLMSFVPEAGGAGRIYLMAEIAGQKGELANAGVLALDYSEAGAQPEISELGWTGGGYEESGKREGCVIPRASEQAVLIDGFKETGGSGKEGVVAFDVYEHESAPHADAIEFAPGGAAGECPHSTLTATVLHAKGVEVKQALPHEKVTFSSIEEVADVESVEWKFENLSTKKSEAPEAGQVEYSP